MQTGGPPATRCPTESMEAATRFTTMARYKQVFCFDERRILESLLGLSKIKIKI